MSEQENINIARKTFDGLNSHNLDASIQYVAENVRGELPGDQKYTNKDQLRSYTRSYLDAFPDLHFDIHDIVAQGDKVAITWEGRGTQNGSLKTPMEGVIPVTGKPVQLTGTTFYEVQNGQITRQEVYFDLMSMMTQIGVIKPEDLSSMLRR